MTNFLNQQIDPPSNWQDFENLCTDLWSKIWKDPNTQRNGRTGQKQNGVDIYGRINSAGDWHGVQCKGKESRFGKQLTKKELIKEVEEAKKFIPAISNFILATTAPNDANIQKLSRQLTSENEKLGLFSVHVFGWNEIQSRLFDYPEVLQKHYPDRGPVQYQIKKTLNALLENQLIGDEKTHQGIQQLSDKLDNINKSGSAIYPITQEATGDPGNMALNSEIDSYRDLIKNKPFTALELFEELKNRCWGEASEKAKFRIKTNIGAIHFKIGDSAKASKYFIEAEQLAPDDTKAISNLALAFILQNDPEKAILEAEKVIVKDPDGPHGYTLLVVAESFGKTKTGFESIVDPSIAQIPEVAYAIGNSYLRHEDYNRAEKWYEIAYNSDRDSIEHRVPYAIAILSGIFEHPDFSQGGQVYEEHERKLDIAISLLKDVWEEVKGSELGPLYISVPINLGNVFRILDENEIAQSYIDDAISIDPHDPDAGRLAALNAIGDGDPLRACDILSIVPRGLSLRVDLFYVESLIRAGKFKKAATQLENIIISDDQKDLESIKKSLELRLIFNKEGKEYFLEASTKAREKYPDDVIIIVTIAKIFNSFGDIEEALEILSNIVSNLNPGHQYADRLYLAESLYEFKQFVVSLTLYEELLTSFRDSHILRRYLICLYNTDQRKKAVDILKGLSDTNKAKKFYRRLSAALHLRIGELPTARKETETYLETEPQDLGFRLNWISILQSQNDDQAIIKFLSSIPTFPRSNPMNRMRLAHIFHYYGFKEQSIKLAYELRRASNRDHEIHMGYIDLLLFHTADEVDLNPQEISSDVAFEIENNQRERKTFIIEDNFEELLLDGEIRSTHLIARAALGKSVGNTITVSQDPIQEENYNIVSVKSKYLYLLHKSTEEYSTLFPEESNFWQLSLKDTGDGKIDFTPVFKCVDAKQSLTLEIEQLYREKQLPIGIISEFLGSDPIDVWRGFMRLGREPIKCCGGKVPERSKTLENLRATTKGCLIDPLTLYLAYSLDVQNELLTTFNTIGITQSTLNLYGYHLEKLKIKPPHGFIGKQGDKYIFNEYSEEDQKQEVNHFQQIHEWAQANCEVLPAVGTHDIPIQWKKLFDIMHPSFIDSILAASGSNRLLLSDDVYLRMLGKLIIDIEGTWLQAALLFALERQNISYKKYSSVTASLIKLNLQFITINSHVLINLGKMDNWAVSERFKTTAASLGKNNVELQSAMKVTTEFLSAIWQERLDLDKKEEFTYAMLNSIRAWRDINIVRFFKTIVILLPKQTEDMYLTTIKKWCIGHFLPWPE